MKTRNKIILGVVIVIVAVPALFSIAGLMRLAAKGQDYVIRAPDTTPHKFVARGLFAASDADMIGTSYANGILRPIEGAHDVLSRIDTDREVVHTSDATITNSVTAWPGTLELSPDGRFAYVVESRGPAPAHVDRVKNVHKDLLEGHLLTTVDLTANEKPTPVRQDDVGIDPTCVHVAPNGEWLIVTTRDDKSPIEFVILKDGVPVEIRRPHTALPSVPPAPPEAMEQENFAGVGYARIAPDGRKIAIQILGKYLVLADVVFDDSGRPSDLRVGPAIQVAQFMSVGRWSLDQRYFIVSDTQWGLLPAETFYAGQGELISIEVDGLNAKVISKAPVSLSPEGMEMSRDGSLFVAVNMERTFLPDGFPMNLIPRRSQASLSLVSFDATNGQLHTVDGPIAFDAVLPEDAVFDRDANMLAVAIFNDRVDQPKDGWIEFFAIDRSQGAPKILPTGRRIRMPRGTHDLAVLY